MSVGRDLLGSIEGSVLESMFSGRHETELQKTADGTGYYLDRNGKIFGSLIDYLRSDRKNYPEFTEKND